jgi:hypothetical protein
MAPNASRLLALTIPVLTFATTLTACGGGGGSSPSPVPHTTTAPTSAPTATLHAGFTQGSIGSSSAHRAIRSARRTVLDTSAGAQLVPTAIFDVPDSYIAAADREPTFPQAFAVAYLSNSTGTGFPSPLPSGSWTQSGTSLPTTAWTPGSTYLTIPDGVLLPDGLNVTNPATTPGQTVFTDTVSGGFGTATVTADAYPALGLAAVPYAAGDYLDPQDYAENGLVFGSNGLATPASSTSAADVYMTEAEDGTTTIFFPHGATVSSANTLITGVPAPASVGSLTTTQIGSASVVGTLVTIQFATAVGAVVKWMPYASIDQSTNPATCGTTNGCVTQLYGTYLASSGDAYAY